jgi:hypothetical protein
MRITGNLQVGEGIRVKRTPLIGNVAEGKEVGVQVY